MIHRTRHAALAALLIGVSSLAVHAQDAATAPLPAPPDFPAQGTPTLVNRSDIFEYKALPDYSEPEWVTKHFVDTGKLPPVAERLPEGAAGLQDRRTCPTASASTATSCATSSAAGPRAGTSCAGQTQGWGGIDIGMVECLTRTGPLFEVKAEDLEPLPNLAKSWEWSEDGNTLTMHLIEGAKWSDGEPFDSDDVMFYWDDHVLDPERARRSTARRRRPSATARRSKARRLHHQVDLQPGLPQSSSSTRWPTAPSARARATSSSRSIRSTRDNTYDEYYQNAFPPTT